MQTDPIVIPIQGDSQDLLADAQAIQQNMDQLKAKLQEAGVSQSAYSQAVRNASKSQEDMVNSSKRVRSELGQTSSTTRQAAISWTEFRSAYMSGMDGVRAAQAIWRETGQVFIDYSEQVKNLSRNIGSSSEESSRLIQVADDVRISYESLNVAMKVAQKQGIEMSVDSLAELSDEYKRLAPGVERTQFLLDKFGKSGLEMGKLMEQGGDKIRAMNEAIDDNLVLSDEAIKRAEEYKRTLDDFNDTVEGAKIAVGENLVPAMNDILKMATANIEAITDLDSAFKAFKEGGIQGLGDWAAEIVGTNLPQFLKDLGFGVKGFEDAADDATVSNEDFADGTYEAGKGAEAESSAVKEADKALQAFKDTLEETSKANEDALGFMMDFAGEANNYADEHAEAVQKVAEAEYELAAAQGKLEDQKGKGGDISGKEMLELYDNVNKAREGVQELEAQWMQSVNQMVYDMTTAKVAADGMTDSEYKALQDLALQLGLITQQQADGAKAAMDLASAYAEGIEASEDVKNENQANADELQRLEEEKQLAIDASTQASLDGAAQTTDALGDVTLSIDSATQSYYAMAQAAYAAADAAATIPATSTSDGSTGSGSTGTDLSGSQVHSQSVQQKNINVTINNPRPSAVRGDVIKSLRLGSFIGG